MTPERIQQKTAGVWVKASERLPEIINGTAYSKFVRYIKNNGDHIPYTTYTIAFYFPERYQLFAFSNYNKSDCSYLERDTESGKIWFRAGWYSIIGLNRSWSPPIEVLEWIDESQPTLTIDQALEVFDDAIQDGIGLHLDKRTYFLNKFKFDIDKMKYL